MASIAERMYIRLLFELLKIYAVSISKFSIIHILIIFSLIIFLTSDEIYILDFLNDMYRLYFDAYHQWSEERLILSHTLSYIMRHW